MKKSKFAAVTAMAVLCSAMPMYSSAAVKINTQPEMKEMSVSGFSLSAPRMDAMASIEKNELILVPPKGGISGGTSFKRSSENLPESFDIRSMNRNTEVKDQGVYGTCWAFSSAASGESSVMNSNPNVNLSELHTSYYAYHGSDQVPTSSAITSDILQYGGTCHVAVNLWSQWIGPVFESRLPYHNIVFFENKAVVDEMKYQCDYHLKNGYIFDYNKERTDFDEINRLVKEYLYNGLAVGISYQSADDKYYSKAYNSTRSVRKPKYANHAVTIIGWDDNFPKENFMVPAENDGAWLIKNSWGEDIYDGGYMWMSYEDRSICEFVVNELDDKDNYKYNYHHDTFVPLQSLSAAEDVNVNAPSYMANIFTAEETMQVEAVSVNIPCAATEYEITIYSDLNDMANPVSGQASTVTKGIVDVTGTVTLELDEAVTVEEGEHFSAVMKLYSENSPYVVPVESVIYLHGDQLDEKISLGTYTDYEGIKENTSALESFYSADGEEWHDPTATDFLYNEEEKADILEQLKEQLFDDIYPEETELLEEAETLYGYYEEAFSMLDLSIALGNFSLKVLGNPVNTVHFSRMTGFVNEGGELELSAENGEKVYYSINGGEYTEYTSPIEINGYNYIKATVDFETYTSRAFIGADFIPEKGDANANGSIDSVDASIVLSHYADVSTGGEGILGKAINDYSDTNNDSIIDSADASRILEIYGERSTK